VRLQGGGSRRLVLQEGDGAIVTLLLLRLLLRRMILPLLRVRHLLGRLDLLLDLLLGVLVRHPSPASIRPLLQRLDLLLQHLLAVAAALAVSQDGVVLALLLQERDGILGQLGRRRAQGRVTGRNGVGEQGANAE